MKAGRARHSMRAVVPRGYFCALLLPLLPPFLPPVNSVPLTTPTAKNPNYMNAAGSF